MPLPKLPSSIASRNSRIEDSLRLIPAGAWAVGVSGGADSVALLALLRARPDLALHVVHLDHQTRGEQSTADAAFVADLAQRWNLPCTIARRDQIEPTLADLPANPSARYRALRLELFRRTVQTHRLSGVILAHHADDQAETVLHRLLRASGYVGLTGISPRATVGGLLILRPLLAVPGAALRTYLIDHHLNWREDASNQSPRYLRNRLRRLLARSPGLSEELLFLAAGCARLRDWARSAAPRLEERFPAATLNALPSILAHESARRWLIERGVRPEHIEPAVIERLLTMAADAASPPRQDFPDRVRLGRRGGWIASQ